MLQLNANRSPTVMKALLNRSATEYDILLIQEPWWGDIGGGNKGGTAGAGWQPILPVPSIANDTIPRVMAYYRKRQDFRVTLRSDIATDLDFQVLEIKQEPFPPTTVVNLYNQPDREDNQRASDRLRRVQLSTTTPVILTGDWNTHHPLWSENPNHQNPNQRATSLVDWMEEHSFTLLNERGDETFISHSGESTSVLDLTWINRQADSHGTIRDWGISPNMCCGSDHYALVWTIDYGAVPILNVMGEKYNWKGADVKKWQDTLKKRLEPYEDLLDTIGDGEATAELLDQTTKVLHDAMAAATKAAVPERKESRQAQPWWNAELSRLHAEHVKIKEDIRRQQRLYGEVDDYIITDSRRLRNKIKRDTRAAAREHYAEEMKNPSREEMWRMTKWGKGRRVYATPPLSRGPGREPAIEHGDKCQALRDELFKPPPDLPNNAPPDLTTTQRDDIAWPPVTKEEVRYALFRPSVKKAPGPTQIGFLALRWAWEVIANIIHRLIAACANAGYHPMLWRLLIAVALRKNNKPDYSNPRAYRLIQLEECFGKILEAVMARRLGYYAIKYNLVPGTQFGCRRGSSTIDAAMTFVHDVQAGWNHKMTTSALTFDIKGYFDFVNHNKLLNILRLKRIPLPMVKWVQSFLTNRSAAICLDGQTSEMAPVQNGIPQGSPISPVLSSFYTADVAAAYQNRQPEQVKIASNSRIPSTKVSLLFFVDDGKIYTASPSIERNVVVLKAAYLHIRGQLHIQGLDDDPDKRELAHYTRAHAEPTVTVLLPDKDGNEVEVKPARLVKWLGIWFDRKLSFNHHVEQMTAKAETALQSLSMLANTTRGIPPLLFRSVYSACVLSVMTYGAAVWWSGKKAHSAKLTRIQNKALIKMCAAFKTSPTTFLEMEAAIPPISLHLDKITERAGVRLTKLHASNPVMARTQVWQLTAADRPPLPPTPENSRRQTPFIMTCIQNITRELDHKNERLDIISQPPWLTGLDRHDGRLTITPAKSGVTKKDEAKAHRDWLREAEWTMDTLLVYTDGSKLEDGRVGAGFVAYHAGVAVFEDKLGLGPYAEVYDAEVQALALAAGCARRHIQSNARYIKHIYFLADNNSAIQSIYSADVMSSQRMATRFRDMVNNYLASDPENKITLRWTPGHSGIRGNDHADRLAKEGAELPTHSTERTLAYALRTTWDNLMEAWTERWATRPPAGRSNAADRFTPSRKPRKHFGAYHRELHGRITQCRIGHAFIGEYYARFVPTEPADCPCGAPLQTRDHILWECELRVYKDHRGPLLRFSPDKRTTDVVGTEEGIAALAEFLDYSPTAYTKTPTY